VTMPLFIVNLAAVLASNYWVTLVHLAGKLMQQAGLSEAEGVSALYPILEGTLHNLSRLGPAVFLLPTLIELGKYLVVRLSNHIATNQ